MSRIYIIDVDSACVRNYIINVEDKATDQSDIMPIPMSHRTQGILAWSGSNGHRESVGPGPVTTLRRVLVRPLPGFYVLRLSHGAPLIPAVIFQFCPMVIPRPETVGGPNPSDWCRPLEGPPGYGALINGDPASAERVWANRSLRPISDKEYAYRMGPLRDWARTNPEMPEARPDQPVDLAALPPLF